MDPTPACLSFGELSDYWTPDVSDADAARIESHVFECARCARLLEEAEQLRRGVGALAQAGRVAAIVTDSLLNQWAEDGVRVRSYVVAPGDSVHCSVWADDEVVVGRLRGDFTDVDAVESEMRFQSGELWARATDVPMAPGTHELLLAFPGDVIRRAPMGPLRVTLRAAAGPRQGALIGEYVFDHQGVHDRADS